MRKLFALFALACGLLAGCASEPQKSEGKAEPAKPAEKPAEYESGRAVFQKLYATARLFAADVKPFRLESTPTKDANGHDGKSGLWRAGFASAARGSVKSFTWSGLTGPDAPERGVMPSTEDTYNPHNASTQVFDVAFLKVDSPDAFRTAQKSGGEKLLKAEPDLPVRYVLDWDMRERKLIWHVIYGEPGGAPKLRLAVDATSGDFLRKER